MDTLPVDLPGGERLATGTDELCVLATSEQTGGALFAATVRMPPGGGPPVLHRHAPGEVYRVLAGEFTFYVGPPDGTVRFTAAFLPRRSHSRRGGRAHDGGRPGHRRAARHRTTRPGPGNPRSTRLTGRGIRDHRYAIALYVACLAC